MKELDNFKEDFAAYHSGRILLLTSYDHGVDDTEGGNSNVGDIDSVEDDKESSNAAKKMPYGPKSILFRAITTFMKPSKNNVVRSTTDNDQRKTKNNFWKRKLKRKTSAVDESARRSYDPPRIV